MFPSLLSRLLVIRQFPLISRSAYILFWADVDEQPVLVPEWTNVLVVCAVLLGQVLDVQQHGVLLGPQLVSYQQVGHQLGAQSCNNTKRTESWRRRCHHC